MPARGSGENLDDPFALPGIGQLPMAGQQVVGHVAWFRGGRNHRGYRRMGEDELEHHLCPGRGAQLLCPAGERLVLDLGEQFATLKRTIDQGGDAVVGAERQQAFLGIACTHRIVELDEVDLVLFQRT